MFYENTYLFDFPFIRIQLLEPNIHSLALIVPHKVSAARFRMMCLNMMEISEQNKCLPRIPSIPESLTSSALPKLIKNLWDN